MDNIGVQSSTPYALEAFWIKLCKFTVENKQVTCSAYDLPTFFFKYNKALQFIAILRSLFSRRVGQELDKNGLCAQRVSQKVDLVKYIVLSIEYSVTCYVALAQT